MDYSDKEIQQMANQDPRVRKALKRSAVSIALILPGVILGTIYSNTFQLLLGTGLFILGFIAMMVSTLSMLLLHKKVRAEIVAKLQREEEDRLAKVKASMTPAEWQSYLLELENNRLLRALSQRSSQKSTTRTVFGYTEGG